MQLPSLKDLGQVKGKRVLVRADFNVPMVKGKIGEGEDWRIRKTLPTIEWLRAHGAKVIIATHLGRPEGKRVASLKLDPVAKRLSELLGAPVLKTEDVVGPKAEAAVSLMEERDVVLLENLRFKAGEEADDAKFAKALAALADCYVNDAFAVCHRKAASVSSITGLLPSVAGLLLEREIEALTKILEKPEHPMIVVMGGAKVSTKIGVIERMLRIADHVLIGGALANPFLKAMGYGIGASLTSPEDEAAAASLLRSPKRARLVLPQQLLIGTAENPESSKAEVVELDAKPHALCDAKHAILDIGPKTIITYAGFIRSAQTIVWNGPLGLFEVPRFGHGTMALGRLIAARSKGRAFGVVGGGESVQALYNTGLMDCVDHVSTGGGAMLEFLEGKTLPGIAALIKKS